METEFFKYLNQIDEKELVALCQSLIKIPSHKEIEGRERKIALFIKDILEREGVEVHLQQVTEGRANVIARIKGEGEGKSLLFNGHMDTVRPYEMDDPYGAKIEAGKITFENIQSGLTREGHQHRRCLRSYSRPTSRQEYLCDSGAER